MKIAFVDCETTGLDPQKHGPHQIVFDLYDLAKGVYKPLETLTVDIMPLPGQMADPKALEVSGHTVESIKAKGRDARECKKAIEDTLGRYVSKFDKADKFFFAAYNAEFDAKMIRALWEKLGDNYYGSWFWHPHIDVMTLAGHFLMERRPAMPNFKLGTVAKELGLVVDETRQHDALYDVHLCREVYQKLTTTK